MTLVKVVEQEMEPATKNLNVNPKMELRPDHALKDMVSVVFVMTFQ